ncbi:hypothetical protein BgramDRAFT_4758 [Paraburkholderia graminis C4D1M]|uniref:Uncharacterized protein n=1 Tax=Paraburkholderia graminis (strain ATCC 700544 / DSM 17151 / LMG 18924 / NCIMB 13744 / C4D1M) TaxID=396598 RepID=B1G5X1_PARG4|nr:hypothetical protein BgramDRAFT_4758 [Paraburkholderia graminis C4D1M]
MQLHRVREDFDPAHFFVRIGALVFGFGGSASIRIRSLTFELGRRSRPAGQHALQLARAAQTGADRLRALGLSGERGLECIELRFERFERGEQRVIVGQLTDRQAHRIFLERKPHVARGTLQRRTELDPVDGIAGMTQALGHRIAREFEKLRGGKRLAEKQRGRFGKLMRLVEDNRIGRGQQFGHAGIAQHDVGEKEVVIHHHDVGLLRLAARLHHEAVLVMRTLLAETVVARRRDHRPHRRRFRHAGELGFVAGSRDLREADDVLQIRGFLARRQAAVIGRALQIVVTQVIRAALEHGHRHGHRQCVAHGRNVALKELVLQVLGARGDDHLAAPQHGRHQIRIGLARARAGLDDQRVLGAVERLCFVGFDGLACGIRAGSLQTPRRTFLRLEHRGLGHRAARRFHGGSDGARHFDLRRPRAIAVDLPRQQTVVGEDVVQFRGAARIERCAQRRRGGTRRGCAGLRGAVGGTRA